MPVVHAPPTAAGAGARFLETAKDHRFLFSAMPWLLLVVAGLFEVGFTTCMKKSDGFRHPQWAAGFLFFAVFSFVFLAMAVRTIPLGTAYAVWTGIGAAGTILAGIALFGEQASPLRLTLVAVIVAAVIGLRLVED